MVKALMTHAKVLVRWEAGLHLRPAMRLVKAAQTFRSTILVKCGDKLADARSLVSILLLTATMNTVLDIEVMGDDETAAAQALQQIFSIDDDGTPDYQLPA